MKDLENEKKKVKKKSVKKIIAPNSLLSKLEDMFENEDTRSPDVILAENYAAYKAFLQDLADKNLPLKVYDTGLKPLQWTDVVFTDLPHFNWAFSVETAESKQRNIDWELKWEEEQIMKDNDLPLFEKQQAIAKMKKEITETMSKDNFEVFTVSKQIETDQEIVDMTKDWLNKNFPEIKIVDVVFDQEGLDQEIYQISKIAERAHNEIENGNFTEL
jgi:hypothetical protein